MQDTFATQFFQNANAWVWKSETWLEREKKTEEKKPKNSKEKKKKDSGKK